MLFILQGVGAGFKGFYPTSLMEQMNRSYKLYKNDMSDVVKPLAVFGQYMQVRIPVVYSRPLFYNLFNT